MNSAIKKYKFTILYYSLVILPGAVLLLAHFYLFMFSSYNFTAKDGSIAGLIALLTVCGSFITLTESM